jgi:hypothetical protein
MDKQPIPEKGIRNEILQGDKVIEKLVAVFASIKSKQSGGFFWENKMLQVNNMGLREIPSKRTA